MTYFEQKNLTVFLKAAKYFLIYCREVLFVFGVSWKRLYKLLSHRPELRLDQLLFSSTCIYSHYVNLFGKKNTF